VGGAVFSVGSGQEHQRTAPARWSATLLSRRGAPGEDQAVVLTASVARSSSRRRSGIEGVIVKQIRGTDPVATVPSVRRRYVDFQRICSALCPA
jgi:hypothetical protein